MSRNLKLSCEVFPPKDENIEEKIKSIKSELNRLKNLGVDLVSVTYGAGGSTRDKTLKLVEELNNDGFNVMPHFTCVCSSLDYIKNYIKDLEKLNIKNILALRGDEPLDAEVCHLDFKYAFELVEYLHKNTNFNIGVAGYPEKHQKAKTFEDDIINLKKKVDMGADSIYTQLFFDNSFFYKFIDMCNKYKINVPIIPGIMPITGYKQIKKMTEMCHATIPKKLYEKLERYQDNNEAIKEIGIEHALNQCQNLVDNGVFGLHFYTLNKAESTQKILEELR